MITGMHIFFVKATFSFEGRNNRDIKIGLLQLKAMLHLLSAFQMSNNVWINNAKDLDTAMPMYKLIDYSKNYRKATVTEIYLILLVLMTMILLLLIVMQAF